ncbi:hypothetical protein B1B04_18735 [Lysinibacillus sp. KCTC 33748]|uniref:tyrosine-type recombinase/integrase n=1 Tax=unclassified Lysinibacillus TaxID=2636778 RepID=UPI0009A8713B|nr:MULTISPECIES: site-specific integrase [unclassified Lysinibacillus]OXS70202.1 hypothetical protein B1B04_18735 [Lysinibacillus sp. KCTC 33748]SKC04578.1 Site-specific recombinase XerD [Lysinibacillus sp. AC-3]
MARPKLKKTRRNNIYSYTDTKNKKKYAYRYKYYDSLGKRKELYKQGFDSDRDAEVALAKLICETDSFLKVVENKNITVSQWMDIWFESKKNDWAISSKKLAKQNIDLYIKPLLGSYKLSNLDYLTYKKEFIDELLKTKSVNTVKSAHSKFLDAVNLAVRNEVLPKNRFSSMTISKENEKKKKSINEENDLNFLNEDDLKKLLQFIKKADDMTKTAVIWTIAFTGMRKGEAAALRWKDIDLQEGTINIYETRDHLGQREAKTKNSIRVVEIEQNLCSLLESYRKKSIEKKLEKGVSHKNTDYVFINLKTLHCIGTNFVANILISVYKKKVISKYISPHGLRHSYATILCGQGVPIPVVAKIIGDTPNTVMVYYAHSLKEKEKEAVQILSKVLL